MSDENCLRGLALSSHLVDHNWSELWLEVPGRWTRSGSGCRLISGNSIRPWWRRKITFLTSSGVVVEEALKDFSC